MAYDSLEQHDVDADVDVDVDIDEAECDAGVDGSAKNSPAARAGASSRNRNRNFNLDLDTTPSLSLSVPQPNQSSSAAVRALRQIVNPISSLKSRARSQTDSSYEMVEEDDYDQEDIEDDEPEDNQTPQETREQGGKGGKEKQETSSSSIPSSEDHDSHDTLDTPSIPPHNPNQHREDHQQASDRRKPPPLRTAVPADDLDLRHPTPVDDQRVRLASYTDKIELLERTAERLSMTSSIDDAIRDLHGELKRNDSRRSPLRSSPPALTTIETRAAAAGGGEEQKEEHEGRPGLRDDAVVEITPTSTVQQQPAMTGADLVAPILAPILTTTTAPTTTTTSATTTTTLATSLDRSPSKSSRFGSRPEPEREGRPLDYFGHAPSAPIPTMAAQPDEQHPTESPVDVTLPEDEQQEDDYTPIADRKLQVVNPEPRTSQDSPSPSSTYSYDAEKMFAGFDGAHGPPQQEQHITIQEPSVDALGISPRRSSFGALLTVDGIDSMGLDSNLQQRPARDRLSFAPDPVVPRQPRLSGAERRSMAMSQSYEDPQTGQQMLYYPAPVPVMLNLPQKLSKAPSSMDRAKRRTQVLSTIPAPARQTAIWLPDVLETEDHPGLPENDETQQLEYVPQHQRMSMGGRRVPQDAQHLPPQLRASAFFDQPIMPEQAVELKEQSAVATLDSILDASAHAPVTAFTDHLIAGHLGAEVYGQAKTPTKGPNRGSTANLLTPEEPPAKKRSSAFNILGRRTSSGNALDGETEKRRAEIIADIRAGKIIHDDDEQEPAAVPGPEIEEPEEEEYHGAPTTLLAELQLRKQQQKHRTRPLATAYPNGMRSTLLQLDAVAQAEAESRKQKPVTLAWEEQAVDDEQEEEEDDDDVPLALIYAKKAQELDANRPLGLIERREMEDNEPLSRRRDRLQGKIAMDRNSLLSVIPPPPPPPPEEEGETLGERLARLNGDNEDAATDLPKARPVSGDFASEMLSQFGGDLLDAEKDKPKDGPVDEEEETLGQRRKRLQAEAQARAEEVGAGAIANTPPPAAEHPDPYKRHSMANILHAHPQAGASAPLHTGKPHTGLLGLNQRMGAARPSTFNPPSRAPAGGFKGGMYNDGHAGTAAPRLAAAQHQQQQAAYNPYNTAALYQFPQPTLGAYGAGFGGGMGYTNPSMMFAGAGGAYQAPVPMPMAYLPQMQNTMASMGMLNANMNMEHMPLNQGQIDMVERWRQSVMQ